MTRKGSPRSRRYPSISLPAALRLSQTLCLAYGPDRAFSLEQAATALARKPGGLAGTVLAALRSYGLLSIERSTRLRNTKEAALLAGPRLASARKQQLLERAFFLPPLFEDVRAALANFGEDTLELPPDRVLRDYLTDRLASTAAVDRCFRSIKESWALVYPRAASLRDGDPKLTRRWKLGDGVVVTVSFSAPITHAQAKRLARHAALFAETFDE